MSRRIYVETLDYQGDIVAVDGVKIFPQRQIQLQRRVKVVKYPSGESRGTPDYVWSTQFNLEIDQDLTIKIAGKIYILQNVAVSQSCHSSDPTQCYSAGIACDLVESDNAA